jgi:hypothetical protein
MDLNLFQPPLESLATVEETVVRDKAVESRESNDSKLTFPQKIMTFPDQRITNSSLYLWINRCMIY